jgi:hypothetical protein
MPSVSPVAGAVVGATPAVNLGYIAGWLITEKQSNNGLEKNRVI